GACVWTGVSALHLQQASCPRDDELGRPSESAKRRHLALGRLAFVASLGMIAQESRDREQARGHLTEALAIVQEAGDKPGIATILARLARATARRGLSVQAVRLYGARRESTKLWARAPC